MSEKNTAVTPPQLENDNSNYVKWRREVNLWKLVTTLDKTKQAVAITLSLKGAAKDVALQLTDAELNAADGFDKLLDKLDEHFKQDSIDECYNYYCSFTRFKRQSGQSITDFVVAFERHYSNMKMKGEMEMSDSLLACALLESASLSNDQRQLVLAASSSTADKMEYKMVKSALKRIMDAPDRSNDEEVLQTSSKKNKGRYVNPSSSTSKDEGGKKNPLNRWGKHTRCAHCQSIYHWVKDCPHPEAKNYSEGSKAESTSKEFANITLFTKEDILITEAKGAAIVDTACSRTVCGEDWLNDYKSNMNQDQLNRLNPVKSFTKFQFGDGKEVCSEQRVSLPAVIGGISCQIESEVVPCKIPLLLGKPSLKKADAVIDVSNDKIQMFGKDMIVEVTSSGHYVIDLMDGLKKGLDPETVLLSQDLKSDYTLEELKKSIVNLHMQAMRSLKTFSNRAIMMCHQRL